MQVRGSTVRQRSVPQQDQAALPVSSPGHAGTQRFIQRGRRKFSQLSSSLGACCLLSMAVPGSQAPGSLWPGTWRTAALDPAASSAAECR